MSEISTSFPPPPPTPTPSGNVLGRKIAGIHQALFVLAVPLLGASGLYLIAIFNQHKFFTDGKNGKFSTENQVLNAWSDSDDLIAGTYGLYLLLYIAFIIIFMVWCNKTTKNLNDNGYRPKKSSGWSVGSFFIPFGNLFFVFGTIKDLLTGLEKFVPSLTNSCQRDMKIWWVLSIISSFILQISDFNITEDSDIDAYLAAAKVDILGALLLLVAVAFGVKAFKKLRDDTKTV